MSINYTTLFSRLGTIVGQINTWIAEQTTLLGTGGGSITTGSLNILAQYTSRPDLTVGLEQSFQSNANSVASWASQLKTYADNTISDLQTTLNASSSSTATILPLMIIDMVANNQTVLKNSGISSTISYGASNTGTGILIASCNSIPGIQNTYDERILNETVKFTCNRDAFSGAVAGSESFSIVGEPSSSVYSNSALGNGNGPSITAGGQNTITNGSFSAYTGAGVFNGWTTVSGSTLISQETVLVQNGSGALKLTGNGTATTVTMTQTGSASIKASSCYAFNTWLRIGTGTFASGSTLTVSLSGTGFSTVNLFNGDPSTLTTTYAAKNTFVNMPSTFSSPVFTIKWVTTSSIASTAIIYLDNITFGSPTNFGNVQYALYPGSTNFLRGDTITSVTANNNAGLFQTFFGRFYNVALPSASSGSNTISDTLVT